MTDPVILLGTQSNGETLPVQVDAFGRLVAEGLQGPEGPEGPEGPQGPEGPPGPGIELPPDPYEGALLGWLNNELSWVGTPPIPIPSNVFGPITAWDPQSGLLTVDGKIPDTVGNGVYLYQCDERGNNYTEGWNVTKVWSDSLTAVDGFYTPDGETADKAFDGSVTTFAAISTTGRDNGTPMVFTQTITDITSLRLMYKGRLYIGGVEIDSQDQNGVWYEVPNPPSTLTEFEIYPYTNGAVAQRLYAVEVNGRVLVDSSSSLNYRVNQVFSETQLVGVPSATVDFTIGKYLRVPEQRVAPWVLYGNDPTSLIDHLRSS